MNLAILGLNYYTAQTPVPFNLNEANNTKMSENLYHQILNIVVFLLFDLVISISKHR